MSPEIAVLTLTDELIYKKFIIDSGRWRHQTLDPEWKYDLFVKDFSELVERHQNSGSKIIKYESKIIAELVKNKNHIEIIMLPELKNLNLEPIIKAEVHKYQTKEFISKVKVVPEMLKRLAKYLPSWL